MKSGLFICLVNLVSLSDRKDDRHHPGQAGKPGPLPPQGRPGARVPSHPHLDNSSKEASHFEFQSLSDALSKNVLPKLHSPFDCIYFSVCVRTGLLLTGHSGGQSTVTL